MRYFASKYDDLLKIVFVSMIEKPNTQNRIIELEDKMKTKFDSVVVD